MHRSMEAATIGDKEQPPAVATTTSGASLEVRLHIGDTAGPDNAVKAPGDLPPQKDPYRLRRVPHWVRDANKDAYAPKFMCFGPYFYYRDVGLRHTELKERYATELLQDADPDDEARRHQLRQFCEQRLREMSSDIREFYADVDPSEAVEIMTTEASAKMMFLDGCFILKHLYNYACSINEKELHQSMWAPAQLRCDITLLENQIPFAVLLALFDHLTPRDLVLRHLRGADDDEKKKKRRRLLEDIALWYMHGGSLHPGKRPTDTMGVDAEVPIHHLLHLLHVAHCAQVDAAVRTRRRGRPQDRDLQFFISALPLWAWLMAVLRCLGVEGPDNDGEMVEEIPAAAELKAMGITITRATTGPVDGRSGTLPFLDVHFLPDRLRLEIPPLYVDQTTEPLLQNLIAFEQQLGADGSDYCTTYAFLMYKLASTRKDIALLRNLRILNYNFGSHEKVINYFMTLCMWNRRSGLTPIDEVLMVLRRCGYLFRDWAKVKNYINNPVKILILIISAMVALSTIMQAFLAIRPPTGH